MATRGVGEGVPPERRYRHRVLSGRPATPKRRPDPPEALAAACGAVQVDAEGRVWRVTRYGRPCTPYRAESPGKAGALVVALCLSGRRLRIPAHRLVYHLLVGPIAPGTKLSWRDGDRSNNRPANIRISASTDSLDVIVGGA